MITMEKIDYVMEATGSPYEVVRNALIRADGDIDKAIEIITNSVANPEKKSAMDISFNDIKDAIKELWDKGNATKLIVEKNGNTILSLTLTLSTIAALTAPLTAVLGIGAGVLAECDFKIISKDGSTTDVKEYIRKMRNKD